MVAEFTPVMPLRGGIVHATNLYAPQHTACGKKFVGWRIALQPLGCAECKLALGLDCRRKRRKVKRKAKK